MSLFRWTCRCVPGLSLLLWIFLAYEALCGRWPFFLSWLGPDVEYRTMYGSHHQLDAWEWLYIIYSVAAHLCACIFFPARLCWSIWHMTDEVRLAKYEAAEVSRPYAESEASSMSIATLESDKASLLSLGTTNTGPSTSPLPTPDTPLSRCGTPKLGGPAADEAVESVTHAIILPSYKEDMDTMRETLSVLASHVLARSSYDVYLAMEQRDPDAQRTAQSLIQAFGTCFRQMTFTLHPGDIPGEVAGKSSNVGWAARQMSLNYTDEVSRRNCVITVMDSDTHLSSNYFLLLTKSHREDPRAGSTLYAVPIIFDRNAQQVNPFVRAADIFWCGAGMSGLYRGSSVKIPTSVYSLAMTLAGDVGGWDTGPDSIGEDMHMYLKCYFESRGRAQVKIIYSPASQSNVTTDIKGWRGAFANIYARYNQALRHMWGSLDTGYAVRRGIEALLRRRQTRSGWLSSSSPEDRVPRWVHDSSLRHFTPPNLDDEPGRENSTTLPGLSSFTGSFSIFRLSLLYHRLYEAHLLPAHLTVALVSGVLYTALVQPANTPPLLLWSFGFNGTLRLVGFFATGAFLYLYESYHRVCVRAREEEMRAAGLWQGMQDAGGFAHRRWKSNWTDYIALPVNGTLFGTLPAVVANFCHFGTDRLVYTVSAKPQLKRMAEKVLSLA